MEMENMETGLEELPAVDDLENGFLNLYLCEKHCDCSFSVAGPEGGDPKVGLNNFLLF
jgi:hypothetical protein